MKAQRNYYLETTLKFTCKILAGLGVLVLTTGSLIGDPAKAQEYPFQKGFQQGFGWGGTPAKAGGPTHNESTQSDGKVLYYIDGKAVYDSPPHVVKIGQISESEYCRRYGGQWCDRNYFKNKVEVSRQKIGKNVTQVEYSNGLRDYIHYCDDGDMTRKYSETTPGYIAVNTSTNSFVESIKYTAPPECAMRGKNSVIVNYQEKMNRCLAEGRCERFTPKETTRQLRWRGCMETIGNKHYKDKICGVYPLW